MRLLQLVGNALRQFGGRIPRIPAFRLLRDMIPNLLFLLFVLNAFPTVVDLICAGSLGDLLLHLRMFRTANMGGYEAELFAVAPGELSAQPRRVTVPVHVNAPAFLSA